MARAPSGQSSGLAHHDLCFGCGIANLFGLQMEAEREADGSVAGRFFVKQDHQGSPGTAHGGVLGAALDEAMALVLFAEGIHARTTRLELDLLALVPVGEFVRIEAAIERHEDGWAWLLAVAREVGEPGRRLAEAHGVFAEVAEG